MWFMLFWPAAMVKKWAWAWQPWCKTVIFHRPLPGVVSGLGRSLMGIKATLDPSVLTFTESDSSPGFIFHLLHTSGGRNGAHSCWGHDLFSQSLFLKSRENIHNFGPYLKQIWLTQIIILWYYHLASKNMKYYNRNCNTNSVKFWLSKIHIFYSVCQQFVTIEEFMKLYLILRFFVFYDLWPNNSCFCFSYKVSKLIVYTGIP